MTKPEPLEYQGHAAIAGFYLSRTWWGVQPARLRDFARIAGAWAELMRRLGYDHYAAQAGTSAR